MNPTQPTGTVPLDPQVVNLAQAIRQTESGGNFNAKGASGESGAYQWLPATWQAHAQQALGDPNAPMTPSNQNAVAYTVIKSWKDQGLNPAQIAAKWNSGSPNGWENKIGTNSQGVSFNVPAYVKSVTDNYQQFKQQSDQQNTAQQGQTTPDQPQDNSGALFPANPNDNPVTAGLKAVGNLPGSALNFGKGVLQSLNPINTASTIGQIGSGFSDFAGQEGTGKAILDIIKGLPEAAYNTLVPQGIRQLIGGDVSGAAKSFTNDPFGQAAPVVLAAEGGANLADSFAGGNAAADAVRGGQLVNNVTKAVAQGSTEGITPVDLNGKGIYGQTFDNTVSGVANPVTNVVGKVAKMPVAFGASVLSHLTSLDPGTMTAIISDPASFSKLQQESTSRASVAEDFGASLDKLIEDKQATGKEYSTIRSGAEPVPVSTDFIYKTLKDNGFDIQNGEITANKSSATRNPADIAALQSFYSNWSDVFRKGITADEFLNMRRDIADLSKFDSAKSGVAATIGKELYAKANEVIRPKIKGLQTLDERMSPQIEQFKKAKKDFLNADGTFKDGAINKIANATGAGKDALLQRMETISPGITRSIKVLKAVEDIQRANGIKVGGYARALIEGGGILTGNLPVIIAAILTHPAIAVQILRGFGITGKAVIPVAEVLKTLAGDTNKKSLVSPIKVAALAQNK